MITEDHYIDYLTRTDLKQLLPPQLLARLAECHFLFLGYSMRDWNLRAILQRLWSERTTRWDSWSIQLAPDPLERKSWELRGVQILEMDLDTYVAGLSQRLTADTREVRASDERSRRGAARRRVSLQRPHPFHRGGFRALFRAGTRERDVIVANLKARRLTLLYGESGVGKSSLLRAGVMRALRDEAQRDFEDDDLGRPEYVPAIVASWSGDPLQTLLDGLASAAVEFVRAPLQLPSSRGSTPRSTRSRPRPTRGCS